MQFHKERVAVGKRIEKAPRGVEAAASFTNPESIDETIPAPFLEQITGEFCIRVNDAFQQEPVSAPDLHELLAECIHDMRTKGGESPDSSWFRPSSLW